MSVLKLKVETKNVYLFLPAKRVDEQTGLTSYLLILNTYLSTTEKNINMKNGCTQHPKERYYAQGRRIER